MTSQYGRFPTTRSRLKGFDLGEMGISCFCARTLTPMQCGGLGPGSIGAFLSLPPSPHPHPSPHLNLSSMPFPLSLISFLCVPQKVLRGSDNRGTVPMDITLEGEGVTLTRARGEIQPSSSYSGAGQDGYEFSCMLS